jgi:hypothetical protein
MPNVGGRVTLVFIGVAGVNDYISARRTEEGAQVILERAILDEMVNHFQGQRARSAVSPEYSPISLKVLLESAENRFRHMSTALTLTS